MVELGESELQLVGVILDDPALELFDRPLSEIGTDEDRARVRIVAIARGENEVIVPRGNDELRRGDHIYCITKKEHIGDLLHQCGKFDHEASHVVIFGATKVGCGVAQNLSRFTKQVKIYDTDPDRVMNAALALPGALVNHGDGTELELLQSEDLGASSAVVAATEDEETNILIGMLAKRAGAGEVIVVVQRPHYTNLVTEIGVDAAVNPHLVTVSEVFRFLRGGSVLALTALEGGEAEVLQFRVRRGQQGVGVPLKELEMPVGSLIGAVLKGRRAVIPTGNTVIEDGDDVIAFARADVVKRLQALFE
jgi:trk system potassium uptake protein TrkA